MTGQIVGVGLGKPGPPDDAGVVDEDVEASELFDRRVDQGLGAFGCGHVTAVRGGGAACGGDLRHHGRGHVGVRSKALHGAAQVVDDHARPPVGEEARMSPADAPARTRHHRDATVEAVRAHHGPFGAGSGAVL
jgi:hypothetical protein